jgi:tripartite-type tricarboxylate transporter receptor subunit TctC
MHVPMEMLKASAGISLTHVPFTGAGPAITALLGKQVEAISTGPSSVAQHIKAGTLRPLAHWGDQPLQALPDTPSLKAEGYPVQFVQWSGLFVPAATPPEVVQRLRDASRKALAAPDVRTRIEGSGSPVQYLDAPEFDAYWKADATMLEAAVIKIGKVE